MSNLYQLTNDVEELYDSLMNSIDEETGEVDEMISKALTVKEQEFNNKAISIATLVRRLENVETEIEAEICRLKTLKDKRKGLREKLSNGLTSACLRLGKDKIEGVSANISFRKSEKVIVENEELIPEALFNVKMTKSPNLTEIKKCIKNGISVPGARIESKNNIQIK